MSTWVLLRGWTRETAHWGDFVAQLQRALPGDAVVALDLPGAGLAREGEVPSRIEAMVEDCRARLRPIAGPGPLRLFGLSLGGMVATEWAARHPGEVERLVLVNTSLRPFAPPWRRLQPRSWPVLLHLAFARDARAAEQAILALTSRGAPRPGVLDAWTAIRHQRPPRARIAWRQLLAALRHRAPAVPPPVPTLLLCSAADALVHPGCSRAIARRWHAPIAEHPRAGHDLPLDDGEWVAGQVARWAAEPAQHGVEQLKPGAQAAKRR